MDRILERHRAARYLIVQVQQKPDHESRQEGAGRSGPDARYRRIERWSWEISGNVDEANRFRALLAAEAYVHDPHFASGPPGPTRRRRRWDGCARPSCASGLA